MIIQSPIEDISGGWRYTEGVLLGHQVEDAERDSCVAAEVPVGVIYGGFSYAVMMATPADLVDFAVGFSVTEGIINSPDDMTELAWRGDDVGVELNVSLSPASMKRFLSRRRVRGLRGHTSCGVCGIEDLASLSRTALMRVRPGRCPQESTILSVFESLRNYQPLSCMTRGAHAAGWASIDGTLRTVREDVGRHNALDKLLGACLRAGSDLSDGFVVITSRCSFEMAQKAATAGVSVMASVSVPTALAIRTAREAGLTLIAPRFDRRPTVYADPNSFMIEAGAR